VSITPKDPHDWPAEALAAIAGDRSYAAVPAKGSPEWNRGMERLLAAIEELDDDE